MPIPNFSNGLNYNYVPVVDPTVLFKKILLNNVNFYSKTLKPQKNNNNNKALLFNIHETIIEQRKNTNIYNIYVVPNIHKINEYLKWYK